MRYVADVTNYIYPSNNRPKILQNEIILKLSQLDFVHKIYSFGSLQSNQWDRWSDIDLIAITESQSDFYELRTDLNHWKLIRHHHPLLPANPNGHHLLGIIFQDESVFHCVDLNLFTYQEIKKTETLERFGNIQLEYKTSQLVPTKPKQTMFTTQVLTVDEKRISTAIHFTKKNIKHVMRQRDAYDDLLKWSKNLHSIMINYSENYHVTGGNIGWVAHRYLEIADYLLNNQTT